MLEAIIIGLIVQAALLLAEAGVRWVNQQVVSPS
jgi:hypothetical protein